MLILDLELELELEQNYCPRRHKKKLLTKEK
jgi:hypothetical protein